MKSKMFEHRFILSVIVVYETLLINYETHFSPNSFDEESNLIFHNKFHVLWTPLILNTSLASLTKLSICVRPQPINLPQIFGSTKIRSDIHITSTSNEIKEFLLVLKILK